MAVYSISTHTGAHTLYTHTLYSTQLRNRHNLAVANGFAMRVCLVTDHYTSVAALPGLVRPITLLCPCKELLSCGASGILSGYLLHAETV